MQQYKVALNSARSTYYSGLIHSNSSNKLLKPMDSLSHSFTVKNVTSSCHSTNQLPTYSKPSPSYAMLITLQKCLFFHLKKLCLSSPPRSFSAAEMLIHDFITSRLNYYNRILYGTSTKILNKVQYF